METLNEKAARNAKIFGVLKIILLIILFIAFIFPFVLVIINVFKTKADITSDPLALVGAHGFTTANFPNAMNKMSFWRSFANSACITIFSTIFTLLLATMAAYVIVRNKWKACGALFGLMIASMVIPFQVLMIPLVSLYGGVLGVLNHRATLIFMHVGFSLSMATFMFHGAINTNVPIALEEAAKIDGCNRWQTFWKIVFPLLKPTIATVAIIDAMAFWNDYLLPPWCWRRRSFTPSRSQHRSSTERIQQISALSWRHCCSLCCRSSFSTSSCRDTSSRVSLPAQSSKRISLRTNKQSLFCSKEGQCNIHMCIDPFV